jgi:GNAT superfamily N-acetyltransferase
VTDAELLAAFDRQVRQSLRPPQTGWEIERVGQVIRVTSPASAEYGCFVEWSSLDASNAAAAIAETVAHYAASGRRFEWKTYGYDTPADLPQRLLAAGFEAEDDESLVVGPVASVVAACAGAEPPAGVKIRAVTDPASLDWAGIGRMHEAVWGRPAEHWVDALVSEVADDPAAISVYVADAGGEIVCAGWVRFTEGTEFASLWGGSTLAQWRRKGIYRAMVARRAELAAERGYAYLQVDASPDSRPILERLGLRVLTTTTPYVWTPPSRRS